MIIVSMSDSVRVGKFFGIMFGVVICSNALGIALKFYVAQILVSTNKSGCVQ